MWLPPQISWGKLALKALPYIAVFLVLSGAIYAVYHAGEKAGAERVTANWNRERLAHARQIEQLRRQIATQETVHRTETRRINDELSVANQKYARAVGALDAEYALRLSNSDRRAAQYQRMSESGATERANLASHAAQLDRSLEQGRRLVQEFRATVEQRDAQLRALGQQILADRALIGHTDGTDSQSVPTQ